MDRLTGATADVLTAKVAALARGGTTSTTADPPSTTPSLCEITTRCDRLVKSSHIMLFMKVGGLPHQLPLPHVHPGAGYPRCPPLRLQQAGGGGATRGRLL